MRNIRQNLFFALAYYGTGIPVAAGILYPFFGIRLSPIIAAAAMALSSLSVVGNANRLRRYHPAPLPPADPVHAEPQVETPGSRAAAARAEAGPVTDPVCGMTVDRSPPPSSVAPDRTPCISAQRAAPTTTPAPASTLLQALAHQAQRPVITQSDALDVLVAAAATPGQ